LVKTVMTRCIQCTRFIFSPANLIIFTYTFWLLYHTLEVRHSFWLLSSKSKYKVLW
jgi:hypothetical protein